VIAATDGNQPKNGCSSTCRKCGDEFALLPTQMVADNCRPALCPFCKRGGKRCHHCSQPFIRKGPGHPTKFCSTLCRDRYQAEWHERHADDTRKPKVVRQCQDCGNDFETVQQAAKRCKECRFELRVTGKTLRTCDGCGDKFRAAKARQCKACRQQADRLRATRASALRYKSQQTAVDISPTAAVGAIAERMFDIACLSRGWVLLTPVSDCNPGFDRTILRGNQFIRVQVKGLRGRRFGDGEQWELGGGWERLNMNAFDELAIVDVDTGFMWLLPKAIARRKFHPTDYAEHETHILGDVLT
jgi:hypothetical protein